MASEGNTGVGPASPGQGSPGTWLGVVRGGPGSGATGVRADLDHAELVGPGAGSAQSVGSGVTGPGAGPLGPATVNGGRKSWVSGPMASA